MPLPIVFRTTDPTIKSFNFIDVVTGTGVSTVYLSQAEQDSGITRQISSFTFETSDDTNASQGAPTGSFTKLGDFDFDAPTNASYQVGGTAIFNFTMYVIGGGADTTDAYMIIKLRKDNGTTETDIASVQTKERSATSTTTYFRETVAMTVPRTGVSVGDTFRVTVEIWAKDDGSSGSNGAGFYADPLNATQYGGFSSQFVAYLPVVVE